jgi:hypothetical protein
MSQSSSAFQMRGRALGPGLARFCPETTNRSELEFYDLSSVRRWSHAVEKGARERGGTYKDAARKPNRWGSRYG